MKDQTANTGRDTKPAKLRDEHLSKDGKWRSFGKVNNLLQYVSTGTYFARVKVDGKLFRRSLDTTTYTTALLKLPDFLKEQRDEKQVDGEPVTFGDAIKLYNADLKADHSIGQSTKRYRKFCIKKLNDTWPSLSKTKLNRIGQSECKSWAGKLAAQVDDQYFNNTLGTLRAILRRGGVRHDPTQGIKRLSVEVPHVELPTLEQFNAIIREMETSGAGQQQACADFARFLAFSGCRLSEARKVKWRDVNLTAGVITVQNAKVRRAGGARVKKTRAVPVIKPMRDLLERLRERYRHRNTDRVCQVGECEKSLARACATVGVQRLTHHKLRDMFATISIESGVDIPTVADWLGHRDGGKLLLERYRKERAEHSAAMAQKVSFGGAL